MELKVCCSEAEQLPWTQALIELLSPQTQFGSVLRCAAGVPSLTRLRSMMGKEGYDLHAIASCDEFPDARCDTSVVLCTDFDREDREHRDEQSEDMHDVGHGF